MTMSYFPADDVYRLYVFWKEGGRGLTSIEDSVNGQIQRFEDRVERRGRRLITDTRNNIDNTRINRTETTRNNRYKNNSMDVLSE